MPPEAAWASGNVAGLGHTVTDTHTGLHSMVKHTQTGTIITYRKPTVSARAAGARGTTHVPANVITGTLWGKDKPKTLEA